MHSLSSFVRTRLSSVLFLRTMLVADNEIENVAPNMKKPTEFTQNFMKVSLVHPQAKMPVYGSSKAAGMDLHACESVEVAAKGKALVATGLKMAIPAGYYGRVAPRSGLAVKNFIDVGAGVIDEDYRGEVKVLLFNFGEQPFKVSPGDRIAQLLVEPVMQPRLEQVAESALDSTERGEGGFGSTGVKTV